MKYRIKNWENFQHYKDRNPPWIKLHHSLLDNIEYNKLSGMAAKNLILIWLLCSEKNGVLPDNDELSFRLRLSLDETQKVTKELLDNYFLVILENEDDLDTRSRSEIEGWSTRYISPEVKGQVFKRDGGKCVNCKSTENVEYDHVLPVSKGGGSDAGNIQLLCRHCNRSKRNRLKLNAEQLATQENKQRSLETETETEKRQRQKRDAIYLKHPLLKTLHDVPMLRGLTLEMWLKCIQNRHKFLNWPKAVKWVCDQAELEGNIKSPGKFVDTRLSYYEKDHLSECKQREEKASIRAKDLKEFIEYMSDKDIPNEHKTQNITDMKKQYGQDFINEAERCLIKGNNL